MRLIIYLGFCFLSVIILKLIPYEEFDGVATIIYNSGSLPGLFTFSLICLFLFIVTAAISFFRYQQTVEGTLVLQRKDLNLKNSFTIIGFYVFIALGAQLLENEIYFVKGTTAYFIIIITFFILFQLSRKIYIRNRKPDYLSVNSEFINFKKIFSSGKRRISNLKSVGYNLRDNSVIFNFQEGLENITLQLTDFEVEDIRKVIDNINHAKGGMLIIEDSYKRHLE